LKLSSSAHKARKKITNIITAQPYAKRGICRHHVSVTFGIVSKRLNVGRITQIMPHDSAETL